MLGQFRFVKVFNNTLGYNILYEYNIILYYKFRGCHVLLEFS
jgi:hypothetical protein